VTTERKSIDAGQYKEENSGLVFWLSIADEACGWYGHETCSCYPTNMARNPRISAWVRVDGFDFCLMIFMVYMYQGW
jgi:hypothetical protein